MVRWKAQLPSVPGLLFLLQDSLLLATRNPASVSVYMKQNRRTAVEERLVGDAIRNPVSPSRQLAWQV